MSTATHEDSTVKASWNLLASKTDPMALGKTRTWECVSKDPHSCAEPCPAHALAWAKQSQTQTPIQSKNPHSNTHNPRTCSTCSGAAGVAYTETLRAGQRKHQNIVKKYPEI